MFHFKVSGNSKYSFIMCSCCREMEHAQSLITFSMVFILKHKDFESDISVGLFFYRDLLFHHPIYADMLTRKSSHGRGHKRASL